MAYAAVISLKHTLKYLGKYLISMSAYKDLESLSYTLRGLDSICDRNINRSAINALDAQIREAVRKVEDALLSHNLWQEEIISFSKTLRKLKEEYSRELDNPLPLQEEEDDVLQADEFDGKNSTTVGLRDQFERIRNELLDSQSEPKVVALFGMAGIGKSHLAREIYRHPLIDERFDFKVWLSVGPQQQVKNVWAEIVAVVEGVPRNTYMKMNIITLVGLLQKNIRGRGRCLIVLDDIWSTKVCDSLIRYLQADGDGRRIMLTTRLEEVAKHQGTSIHQIRFMDKEESWKLLQLNVFGEEYFPRELEEAGRKIADNCEGLPLLILAVAEILCGFEKTEEYWNKVADSKTTTFTDAYEKISEVLFSSYEYLPQYLRACFLYMGVFPQKYQIPLPKLLHLWIVDDVLEPQQCLITRKRYAKSQSTNKIVEPLMRNRKVLVSRIPEYVDLLEPNRSETSSLRVLEDDCLEPNWLDTSGVRISEDVDLLEPNWLENSGIKITEDVDLLEPDWSKTSSLRVLEDVDMSETNRLENSSLRISEDVDLLEPNRLETSIIENVDFVEPKPDQLETSSLRILEDVDLLEPDQLENPSSCILENVDLVEPNWLETSSLMISEDVDLPKLNLFETSSVRISEDVEFLEPNLLETSNVRILEDDTLSRAERFLPRVDSRASYDVFSNSQRNDFKFCRYEAKKPLESLYLLEPGPSPIRFIEPWEKSKSRDSRLCLNRDLWPPTREQPLPTAMDMSVPKVKTTPKGIAMDHLKKLVSHSLAIVCKRSSTSKIKSCKLHSAYWYLCAKEARKNKFFHVLKKLNDATTDYIERQRRLAVQNNMLFGIKEAYDSMAVALTAQSLLCTGPVQEYPVPICLNLRLLKVLDAVAIRLYDFPTEVVKLLELRYLALTHNGNLPSSISELQQLEYLIVGQHHNIKLLKDSSSWPEARRIEFLRDSTSLPQEIWGMKALVYLWIIGRNLPDPSYRSELPKLLTLHVNAHSCTIAVFSSIPFLKKLGIIIELQPDIAETLSCFEHINLLERLHSLKCVISNPRQSSNVVAPPDHLSNLPSSLKKVSLNGMGYSWEDMGKIGSLPRLKVLKLRYFAFQGPVWIVMAGEFQSLEFLLLEDIDLVHWTTDDGDGGCCFPSLQCLIIRHCYKLKEIPSQIGCMPTLKRIEIVDCSPSMVASALQIQDKRSSTLQVVVSSSWNRR